MVRLAIAVAAVPAALAARADRAPAAPPGSAGVSLDSILGPSRAPDFCASRLPVRSEETAGPEDLEDKEDKERPAATLGWG